jgi:hypothetical protein
VLIGKGNGAVLLSDGDILVISPRLRLVFHSNLPCQISCLDPLQTSEVEVS